MEDRQGILVRSSPAFFFIGGEGNHTSMYIVAICLASALKAHLSSRISEAAARSGQLPYLISGTSPLKRKKCRKDAKVVPQDSDATAHQANGEGSIGSIIPGLDDESASRCIAFASRSTYGALSLTHRKLRDLVRSGYIYEIRRRLGVVEQWVYLFANGYSNWKAFDPKRRMWLQLPPCTTDYVFSMSDKESLSAGTHLLWMGREITDYTIFRYELTTNTWFRGPSMNHSRCLFASASCGEYAFVAGGNRDGVILKSAERYNSQLRTWELLPDMNIARQKSSGCFMDGKFYVIGGRDSRHRRLTSGEEYDPVARRWRVIENMFPAPAGREMMESSPPLVAVVKDNLYCIDSSINELMVYDKENSSWRTLGSVPVRADFNNGWGLAFKALGDKLYVIGGYRAPQGMAMFSWRPELNGAPPVWDTVITLFAAAGSFLTNCAVMAC